MVNGTYVFTEARPVGRSVLILNSPILFGDVYCGLELDTLGQSIDNPTTLIQIRRHWSIGIDLGFLSFFFSVFSINKRQSSFPPWKQTFIEFNDFSKNLINHRSMN